MLTQEERILLTKLQKEILTLIEDTHLTPKEVAFKLNMDDQQIRKIAQFARYQLRFLRAKKCRR